MCTCPPPHAEFDVVPAVACHPRGYPFGTVLGLYRNGEDPLEGTGWEARDNKPKPKSMRPNLENIIKRI